ncbi:MAG: hypothetical protein GWP08_07420 [Nitrospiraceae bacterium]|nr:hypothetical protein [Nitrospiraceae bacterium]
MRFGFCLFVTACLLSVWCSDSWGRGYPHYGLTDLVEKSDVLVVGEVTKVSAMGEVSPEDTEWVFSLLAMRVRFRILRAFLAVRDSSLARGAEIEFECEAINRNGEVPGGGNTPEFPLFEEGVCCALPLVKIAPGEQPEAYKWTDRSDYPGERPPRWLIDKEGFGLVVPAVAARPTGGEPANGADFLRAEVVNAMAQRGHRDTLRAIRFLWINSSWCPTFTWRFISPRRSGHRP